MNSTLAAPSTGEVTLSTVSFIVPPINNIFRAIRQGHFSSAHPHICKSDIRLPPIEHSKQVFTATFSATVHQKDLAHILGQHGLEICANATCYLLGLASQASEQDMPSILQGKSLVAIEPNGWFPLKSPQSRGAYLYIKRDAFNGVRAKKRTLEFTHIFDMWYPYWAILAQEI